MRHSIPRNSCLVYVGNGFTSDIALSIHNLVLILFILHTSYFFLDKVSTSYSPVDCDVFYNLTEDQPTITVTSPGHPRHYPELTSCHMIVIAPFGKQVVVEFSYFNLEDGAR